MTLEITKAHLVKVLTDQTNKVVALSGKWGTGKSHLWDEVKEASTDEKVKAAIYVSLFGLGSMDQIKVKIVQSAVPIAAEHPKIFQGASKTIGAIRTALEGFNKRFAALGALGEFAMLLTPMILKNKIIVLDDIERKHQNLDVDEILGFIDEFTQRHGSRFVLILNSDQLLDKHLWEKFREKVIDQEIRLNTLPIEAFRIAVGLTPSPYAERIREAVDTCGLTNIRIIQKVIKAVNRILDNRLNLSEAVLSRVIPSTVLLSAIHYKGLDDGPTMEYVLATGTPAGWDSYMGTNEQKEPTEEDKLKAKWKLMLDKMSLLVCDEYELLVADFLESGLFELEAVSTIIDRYVAEEQSMVARELARLFMQDKFWNHPLTEEQLLVRARELLPHAQWIDAANLTALCDTVCDLLGGEAIADEMIVSWIAAYRVKSHEPIDEDYPFHRKIHPLIQTEWDATKAQAQARITVFEVCEQVVNESGWGTRHKLVMRSATVEDFCRAIKTLSVPDLRLFMSQMLDFLTKKEVYGPDFSLGADRFAEACRDIANDPHSGRLGKLIKTLFEDAKVADFLKPPLPPSA